MAKTKWLFLLSVILALLPSLSDWPTGTIATGDILLLLAAAFFSLWAAQPQQMRHS